MKNLELNNEEILEYLKIVKYDKNKHTSLHQAIQDFFSEEKYDNIMKGIVTDANALKEVQVMLEAFNKLKDYEEEIVSGKIFDDNTEYKDEELDQFVRVANEDGYRILKKNLLDKCYDTICEGQKYANFYVKDSKVYNFQGNVVFDRDFEKIEYINNGVLKIDNYYLTIDGNMIISRTPAIDKIISSIERKEVWDFLNYVYNSTYLPYLNEEILSVTDDLICSKICGCISYYKLNGEKIISNDLNGYCYIDSEVSSGYDGRHIVSVGKLGEKLNKVYGYYDLDKQEEVCPLQFVTPTPWINYGAVAYTDKHFCFVNEFGEVIKYEVSLKGEFPIYVKKQCYKHYGSEHLYKEVIRNGADSFVFYKPYYLKKLKDDIYICTYQREKYYNKEFLQKAAWKTPEFCKSLIKILNGVPTVIGNVYENIIQLSKDLEMFLVVNDRWNDGYKILSLDGEEREIRFSNSVNKEKKKSYYSLDTTFKNSLFLESDYKNVMNDILEDKSSSKNAIAPTTNLVAKINKNYLSTTSSVSFKSNDIPNATLVHSAYDNGFGVVKLGIYGEFDKCIYDESGNYFVIGKDFDSELDKYNNILLEFYYEGKKDYLNKRKMLIDRNGELLIGISKEIELDNEYYIVTRCDNKKQVFDKNALPLTLPSDDVKLTDKLYVDKNGIVRKEEKKLVIVNCGYEYLLDDDQDYLIYENSIYKDVLGDIKRLVLHKEEK